MKATGFQLLFLYFAGTFGAMLVSRFLETSGAFPSEYFHPVSQAITFMLAGLVLVLVPVMRRDAIAMLSIPIARERRKEVAAAVLVKLAVPFGLVGAIALAAILSDDRSLLAKVPLSSDPEAQLVRTLMPAMLAFEIGVAWLIGPLLEEIYFRGFLYHAWEKQWGWIPASLLTSSAFGIAHPSHIVSSFLGSLVFIAILRRTGSLRASFYVHASFNALVFWPLYGHLIYANRPGEPLAWSTWSVEIACFFIMLTAIPLCLYLARDRSAVPASAP
jgi:uncharacterized protein